MEDRGRSWWQTIYGINMIALVLLGIIGYFDYCVFYEINVALFYLLPIAGIAWYGQRKMDIVISLLALVIWSGCEILEGDHYSNAFIHLWAIGIHGVGFIGASLLLRRLHEALAEAKQRADSDFLTSLPNRQCFYRLAQYNIDKSLKLNKPLTVAYLDIDHFKQVNDTMGHDAGDELLKCVAKYLQESVRSTDIVARLGGDEFAILLPHTQFPLAKQVLERVHEQLQTAVDAGGWPVTFSIGACAFMRPPEKIDELLQQADAVMYAVKRDGKNELRVVVPASQ